MASYATKGSGPKVYEQGGADWKPEWDGAIEKATTALKSRSEFYKDRNTAYGLRPPDSSGWQFGGFQVGPQRRREVDIGKMDLRVGPDMYDQPREPDPPRRLIPVWNRASQPTTYVDTPTPGATPSDITNRQEALTRAQEHSKQAMEAATSGTQSDASSTGSSGSMATTPTPARSNELGGSAPMSFADISAYGRSYNASAEADRNLYTAQAQTGIPEVAFANEQLVKGIDPEKMNISEPESWETTLAKLTKLRELIT